MFWQNCVWCGICMWVRACLHASRGVRMQYVWMCVGVFSVGACLHKSTNSATDSKATYCLTSHLCRVENISTGKLPMGRCERPHLSYLCVLLIGQPDVRMLMPSHNKLMLLLLKCHLRKNLTGQPSGSVYISHHSCRRYFGDPFLTGGGWRMC